MGRRHRSLQLAWGVQAGDRDSGLQRVNGVENPRAGRAWKNTPRSRRGARAQGQMLVRIRGRRAFASDPGSKVTLSKESGRSF